MRNLQFLTVHKRKHCEKDIVCIPQDLEFPPRLKLLHWEVYPRKSLPMRFHLENLVELNMRDSQLEKLWEGSQVWFSSDIYVWMRSSFSCSDGLLFVFFLCLFWFRLLLNIKKICLSMSYHLKELSDLSNAKKISRDWVWMTAWVWLRLHPLFFESSQAKNVEHVCLRKARSHSRSHELGTSWMGWYDLIPKIKELSRNL